MSHLAYGSSGKSPTRSYQGWGIAHSPAWLAVHKRGKTFHLGAGAAPHEQCKTYHYDYPIVLQFEEIQAIIWRYKMLVRMRKALLQADRGLREAKQEAKELSQCVEDDSLQYNNDLDQLQLRSQQAHRDVLTWVRKDGAGRGTSPRPEMN